MFELYDRQLNCKTTIYHVFENGQYLIFDPNQLKGNKANNGGNGWVRVKAARFVPLEYVDLAGTYLSKSEKNKIKSRLKLTSAVWTCTDGTDFTDCEAAIVHERELFEIETPEGI